MGAPPAHALANIRSEPRGFGDAFHHPRRIVSGMTRAEAGRRLLPRIKEVAREIGVLLVVFAPIDYVIAADTQGRRTWLLIFLCIGAFLLGGSLFAEYRRHRVD